MQLFPLLAISLVKFNVCFVSSQSAKGQDDQDMTSSESLFSRAYESHIIINSVQTNRDGPKKDKPDIEDKSKEARVNFLTNGLQAIRNAYSRPWDPVEAFNCLKGRNNLLRSPHFTKWLNELATFLKENVNFDYDAFIRLIDERSRSFEDQVSLYAWLLEFPHVKDAAAKKMMVLATTNVDKYPIFEALAKFDVRPDNLFRAMGLRNKLSLNGMHNTDLFFLRWFEYVQMYGSVNIKSDKRPASEVFDDEDLLAFLANEMTILYVEVEESLPVHSNRFGAETISTIAFEQVVALFESLRQYSEVESFSDSMLRYMILNPLTMPLVLKSWSKSQLVPIQSFNILRLGEDFLRADYVSLFTAWLQHVKSYCKDLAPEGNHVLYAHLLSPVTLNSAVKTFFQSSEFIWMLDDIKMLSVMDDTGTLLQILSVPWRVKDWLDARMNPKMVFLLSQKRGPVAFTKLETGSALTLTLTNKFGSYDIDLLEWLSFVVLFKQKHQEFSINDVCLLLRQTMSINDLLTLFLSARQVPTLEDLANDMLKYIFRKINITANFDADTYWRFLFPDGSTAADKDYFLFFEWFRRASLSDSDIVSSLEVLLEKTDGTIVRLWLEKVGASMENKNAISLQISLNKYLAKRRVPLSHTNSAS